MKLSRCGAAVWRKAGYGGAATTAVLRRCGAAVRRCGGPAEAGVLRRCATAVAAVDGRHFDVAVVDRWVWRCWFASVRLLEPTPCKPSLRPGPAILRTSKHTAAMVGVICGAEVWTASVCRGSRREPGAIPLVAGGGAERWRATRSRGAAGGPVKPRRLTGPGGRSWGAELERGAGRRRRRVGGIGGAASGGAAGQLAGVALLAQSAKLPKGWRCRRARSFTEMPGRNAGARNWRGRRKTGGGTKLAHW